MKKIIKGIMAILLPIMIVITLYTFLSWGFADIMESYQSRQEVKEYITNTYGEDYKAVYVNHDSPLITDRINKEKVVLVEVIKSKSNGNGIGKVFGNDNEYIVYGDHIKKNKVVKTYMIYSITNNDPTDITAKVTIGKLIN